METRYTVKCVGGFRDGNVWPEPIPPNTVLELDEQTFNRLKQSDPDCWEILDVVKKVPPPTKSKPSAEEKAEAKAEKEAKAEAEKEAKAKAKAEKKAKKEAESEGKTGIIEGAKAALGLDKPEDAPDEAVKEQEPEDAEEG
jgi:hypothetical protein